MTPAEVAALLGVTEGTLAVKRSRGLGPVYTKPGRVFYYQSDVDDYIRRKRVLPNGRAVRRRCRR